MRAVLHKGGKGGGGALSIVVTKPRKRTIYLPDALGEREHG